ncbi:MAG: hypothetical protein A2Y82_00765 [Candidatus Buchananbacteria bacterium RBG_13_36_9]|uniref:Uncharacterized protein n=1 Tax=Candidatus Buchananbacteria bacterium RBG_13_36_9 TaxID=1797530 RepID=A0A1G1XND9_9BACT|nr:MAG: hypothetical protein A2Y82_00765 [Candidatus Buchananbacteria bacterium RBG_13_36_9]
MLESGIKAETLLIILHDIEEEIRADGISQQKKALLFHQLGSVHSLMGDKDQQKFAWRQAEKLDPDNDFIRNSVKSLK